jgi:hypothetical protein
MSMQSRATLAAFKTLQRVSGEAVTIRRGASSASVTAVPGDTLVDREDDEGQSVRAKVRDYLVLRSDFESAINVVGGEPERGDEFDQVVADYTRTYHAIELGDEVFRYWDKAGQVLRIHTLEREKVTTTTTTAGA